VDSPLLLGRASQGFLLARMYFLSSPTFNCPSSCLVKSSWKPYLPGMIEVIWLMDLLEKPILKFYLLLLSTLLPSSKMETRCVDRKICGDGPKTYKSFTESYFKHAPVKINISQFFKQGHGAGPLKSWIHQVSYLVDCCVWGCGLISL